MKVGDLVRHIDGDVGILLEIKREDHLYPYRILFRSHRFQSHFSDWYNADYIVGVVSEGR